ncbi:hypothetical protein [Streptomyces sp. NPDC002889]|uniref:hypothetical protein n=1 Tax=Streptomyces sp. NPDC002889 TaxID=3364669 RepID=UPI0036BB9AFF
MITMKFSVRPGQGETSGFDLGDMLCAGALGEASSVGNIPDQGMMIYPSVTLLLDGLISLLKSREKVLRFTGVDTSFGLVFKVDKKGLIAVSAEKKLLDRVSQGELVQTVLQAAQQLAASSLSQLPGADAVRDDYLAALKDFRVLAEEWTAGP